MDGKVARSRGSGLQTGFAAFRPESGGGRRRGRCFCLRGRGSALSVLGWGKVGSAFQPLGSARRKIEHHFSANSPCGPRCGTQDRPPLAATSATTVHLAHGVNSRGNRRTCLAEVLSACGLKRPRALRRSQRIDPRSAALSQVTHTPLRIQPFEDRAHGLKCVLAYLLVLSRPVVLEGRDRSGALLGHRPRAPVSLRAGRAGARAAVSAPRRLPLPPFQASLSFVSSPSHGRGKTRRTPPVSPLQHRWGRERSGCGNGRMGGWVYRA